MTMFDDAKQECEHQQKAEQAAIDWQKLYSWTQALPEGAVLEGESLEPFAKLSQDLRKQKRSYCLFLWCIFIS